MFFSVSESWQKTYPGAVVGMMTVTGINNQKKNILLEERKRELEEQIRTRIISKEDLTDHPVIQAYNSYYKRFKKSYHVRLQLESIALKHKPIPTVNALVETMFMAELKNMLLTAGHDLDAVELPVVLDTAVGIEKYLLLNGKEQICKQGDMIVSDKNGIISSVIHGPDSRTCITEDTQRALFVVYAPVGVGAERVRQHLIEIRNLINDFSLDARIESMETTADADYKD